MTPQIFEIGTLRLEKIIKFEIFENFDSWDISRSESKFQAVINFVPDFEADFE